MVHPTAHAQTGFEPVERELALRTQRGMTDDWLVEAFTTSYYTEYESPAPAADSQHQQSHVAEADEYELTMAHA
jgi:hypothetical protein